MNKKDFIEVMIIMVVTMVSAVVISLFIFGAICFGQRLYSIYSSKNTTAVEKVVTIDTAEFGRINISRE